MADRATVIAMTSRLRRAAGADLEVEVVAEHGADLVEVLQQRHHVLGGALALVQQVVLQLVHLAFHRVHLRLCNHQSNDVSQCYTHSYT